jgi:glutathione S-transferase
MESSSCRTETATRRRSPRPSARRVALAPIDSKGVKGPMLRLHGFASSNYHNVVKLVLIEKGLEFEEVTSYPPADEAYRSKNPIGKFPCLETEDGVVLGESKVILDYLEDAYPAVPLLPADPLERARVRELMEIVDLYLELPARRLYPQALFEQTVSDEIKDTARAELDRGVTALKARARYAPYVAGPTLTLADFGAAIHCPLISITTKAIYGEDLLEALPAVKRHRAMMGERASFKRVKADRAADVPAFARHRAGLSAPGGPDHRP